MPTRHVGPRLARAWSFSRVLALSLAALLLVPAGCSTAARTVRLETGEDKALVVTPRGGEPPVLLREEEFKASLAVQVRDVRPAANPLQHARQVMLHSAWHEDVYLRWTGRRLELDSEGEPAQECLELTQDYGRWCEGQRRPRDCLSRLIEIHGLGKNGGTLMNRINSIARTNPKYAAALRRGLELLESAGYRGR